jgi:hypothetical protein
VALLPILEKRRITVSDLARGSGMKCLGLSWTDDDFGCGQICFFAKCRPEYRSPCLATVLIKESELQ